MSDLKTTRPSRLSMEGYIFNANQVVVEALHPRHNHNRAKLSQLAAKSKAILACSVFQAGALMTGHYGTGVLISKRPDNKWSAPIAIQLAGYSMGALIGAKVDSTLIFILDDKTLEDFCVKPQTHMGVSGGLSAGGLGGSTSVGVDAEGSVAFSLTKGAFMGVGIQLGTLANAPRQNEVFYKVDKIAPKDVLMKDDQVTIDPHTQIPHLHEKLDKLVHGESWEPSDEDLERSKHFCKIAAESSRNLVAAAGSSPIAAKQ